MVDDFTPQDPGNTPDDQPAVETGGTKTGFLSTTAGRLVLIGGAVFGFLVIAGLVTLAVVFFWLGSAAQDVANEVSGEIERSQQEASAELTGTPSSVEPGEVPLSSIFTFRDVFDPLIKPAPSGDGTTGDGTTGDGTTGDGTTGDGTVTTGEDVLYLQDIVVEDGVPVAVLLWNNAEYRLAAGEVLPNTPWKVMSVYSGSVTMLFGDSQVTLVVGQGMATK